MLISRSFFYNWNLTLLRNRVQLHVSCAYANRVTFPSPFKWVQFVKTWIIFSEEKKGKLDPIHD
jgi:hypothetical protein